MYKLIGTPVARPFRVLWALEELGLDYEVVPAPPRSDEALQYNPSGKVPVLVEDDDIVIDSVAIVQYLADKHGNLTYPAGTIERAKQDSFTVPVTISTAFYGQWRNTRLYCLKKLEPRESDKPVNMTLHVP